MNELILHPTASTPIPVTLIDSRPRRRRSASPKAVSVKHATREDLVALCEARGLKHTTKHTKAELLTILRTGSYQPAAAYLREKAKRQAARKAA